MNLETGVEIKTSKELTIIPWLKLFYLNNKLLQTILENEFQKFNVWRQNIIEYGSIWRVDYNYFNVTLKCVHNANKLNWHNESFLRYVKNAIEIF